MCKNARLTFKPQRRCSGVALIAFLVIVTGIATVFLVCRFRDLQENNQLSFLHTTNIATAGAAINNDDLKASTTLYVIGATKRVAKRHLPGLSRNLAMVLSLSQKAKVILYCDESSERAFRLLHDSRFVYIRENFSSPYRTHRLAYGRNLLLRAVGESILTNKEDASNVLVAVMDLDNACSSFDFNREVIATVLSQRHLWDAVSFNRPVYYDLWALRYYRHDYNLWARVHNNNSRSRSRGSGHNEQRQEHASTILIDQIRHDLQSDMNQPSTRGDYFPVYSAFGGFALYKYLYTVGCNYDGYNSQGDIFDNQDCEHVPFHKCMIRRNSARVMIYKYSL